LADRSLVFRAGEHLCALGVESVIEIMRPLPVEALAGAASFVAGVSVIRGRPLPVVEVARLVGGESDPVTRFVVAADGRHPVALAVQSVLGVREFDPRARQDFPPLLRSTRADAVRAVDVVDAEPLLVLDSARIVPDEVWAAFEAEYPQ
jgi:purine-binding chemotaxis protein CheW